MRSHFIDVTRSILHDDFVGVLVKLFVWVNGDNYISDVRLELNDTNGT